MDEADLAYLGGVIDSVARFRVKIRPDQDYSTGYSLTPLLTMNRSGEQQVVFGFLDDYCIERNLSLNFEDSTGDSLRGKILGREDLRTFLEPFSEYLIQQREIVAIFVDVLLPLFDEGAHLTEAGIIDITEVIDELYELDPTVQGRERKYTAEYFKNQFE